MAFIANNITASSATFSNLSATSSFAVTSSYSLTASFALNTSNVDSGSFILTSSQATQSIIGDLWVSNLGGIGSGSFYSGIYVGNQETGIFRIKTSGSNINNIALTIELYSGSWIECGYFKK